MSQTTTVSFSISQVLNQAWQVLKQKWTFLLGVWVALLGVSMGLGFIQGIIGAAVGAGQEDQSSMAVMIQMVLSLATQVASMILGIGVVKVILKVVRGQAAEIKEIFSGAKYFLQYILGSLVIGLIVFVGLLLLVVPGIIWSLKYMFALILIIDEGLNVTDSMAKSALMTEGIKWKLIGFGLAMAGLNLLGCIPLFLGLIITVPVTTLASYVLYTQLRDQVSESTKAVAKS